MVCISVHLVCRFDVQKRPDAVHLVCSRTKMVCIGVHEAQNDVHWCALVCSRREYCRCVHHTIFGRMRAEG